MFPSFFHIIMSLRGLLFSAASPLRYPSYTTNTWPIKPPALPMSEIRPEPRINKTSPGPPFRCKDAHMEKIFLCSTKETTYATNYNKSRSTSIANSFTACSYIKVYRLLKKRRNTILVSRATFQKNCVDVKSLSKDIPIALSTFNIKIPFQYRIWWVPQNSKSQIPSREGI